MKGYREQEVVSNAQNAGVKYPESIENGKIKILCAVFGAAVNTGIDKNQEVCIIITQK